MLVVDEFGFKGKEVIIIIVKVGGEEEELIMKLFCVCIWLLVSWNVIYIVIVVGILCISSDIIEIKFSYVVGIFGFGKEEICRRSGLVDLFVGIDYLKLYIGEIREVVNFIVR